MARSLSFIAVHNLVGSLLEAGGTEAQKQRWLPPMAGGRALAAFALTEPEAGSDKQFISHADQA